MERLRLFEERCGQIHDDGTQCIVGVGIGVEMLVNAEGQSLASLGRVIRTVAYCSHHGGTGRAHREAVSSWGYLAPASVGDDEAVLEAGIRGLGTLDAYIVLREERGVWLAFRGIGGAMIAIPNPRGMTSDDRRRVRRGEQPRGETSFAFASEAEAYDVASDAWSRHLEQTVAAITRIRGGTLAWGRPVAPLELPIVVRSTGKGDTWEEAQKIPRVCREATGLEGLLGLRASGEVL